MKKQDYRKPTTKIVLLQQQTHLLQASPKDSVTQGNLGDEQDPIEEDWDDEE